MTLDVLSCADLVAGTLEHFLTRRQRFGESVTVKEQANEIASWLSGQGIMLKRFSFKVDRRDEKYAFGTLELVPKSKRKAAKSCSTFGHARLHDSHLQIAVG
jgi:hypothetical protein